MLLEMPNSRSSGNAYNSSAMKSSTADGLQPCQSTQAPQYKPAPRLLERSEILASFGLMERDLEFMGPQQRAMVEDVIEHVLCVHAVA